MVHDCDSDFVRIFIFSMFRIHFIQCVLDGVSSRCWMFEYVYNSIETFFSSRCLGAPVCKFDMKLGRTDEYIDFIIVWNCLCVCVFAMFDKLTSAK